MNLKNLIKTIGPGLLFAGVAIGGSHLVQSTRAGANYGFMLIGIVLLANVLKYPFFEYGHRYTAITGKSLLEGYKRLGRPVLLLFFGLCFCTAMVNCAAVTMVTAGIAGELAPWSISIVQWSAIIMIAVISILFIGHYGWLDRLIKIIILILTLSTVFAVVLAFAKGSQAAPDYQSDSIFNLAGLSFLIALMGWMPAPIEGSVWPSLWMLEKQKMTGYKPTYKEVKIDFNIGYILTAVLAVCFVCLGALVMYGTGREFSASGIQFAGQVIQLYAESLGAWSKPIIGLAALTTMISTTLTLTDAYPRTLTGCLTISFDKLKKSENILYPLWMLGMCGTALLVILCFKKDLKSMIDFATTLSFLAAPIFAYINYRVVTNPDTPLECYPGLGMRILSWIGIIFLSCFSITFIVWRFLA